MSAYRSEVPQLEHRVRELEEQLRAHDAEEQLPLVRARRLRDARTSLVARLGLLAATTLVTFAAGAFWGSSLGHVDLPGTPRPQLPTTTDPRAVAQLERCHAARRVAEVELHDCEVALGDALAGNGVEVATGNAEADDLARTLLAPYAASVLTCGAGPIDVDVDFTVPAFPSPRVAPGLGPDVESCVRGALATLPGSTPLGGEVIRVRFRLPG